MLRRAFIKRFSAGVLGCGMLAEALLSKGPSMEVVESLGRPVATASFKGRGMDLGPRVRQRPDMEYRWEHRHGVVYLNGRANY
jgi:hypothetical protein